MTCIGHVASMMVMSSTRRPRLSTNASTPSAAGGSASRNADPECSDRRPWPPSPTRAHLELSSAQPSMYHIVTWGPVTSTAEFTPLRQPAAPCPSPLSPGHFGSTTWDPHPPATRAASPTSWARRYGRFAAGGTERTRPWDYTSFANQRFADTTHWVRPPIVVCRAWPGSLTSWIAQGTPSDS